MNLSALEVLVVAFTSSYRLARRRLLPVLRRCRGFLIPNDSSRIKLFVSIVEVYLECVLHFHVCDKCWPNTISSFQIFFRHNSPPSPFLFVRQSHLFHTGPQIDIWLRFSIKRFTMLVYFAASFPSFSNFISLLGDDFELTTILFWLFFLPDYLSGLLSSLFYHVRTPTCSFSLYNSRQTAAPLPLFLPSHSLPSIRLQRVHF